MHVRRVHNKYDKNYKCSLCNKTYGQNKDLKNHVEGVHLKTRSFQCEVCEETFNFKASLRKHVIRTHSTVLYK